ncbi:hypothetical protein BCU68_04040 [Vibrio sp. 10N.286.49.B3]|uniref:methyl-accepting chemotaxis protein n=1 Tax=Vibrio sp. 10N.286.49.B3 TaxID=1880855 RepID=UPI000C83C52A|nr:methyl-accepting chemotaxis protein [Vibrio sp. 10N.286.49.B3]PMH43166.1 hypothetical protein BCU68_04040 [Vibrio sp. 10N.286.49.B3]
MNLSKKISIVQLNAIIFSLFVVLIIFVGLGGWKLASSVDETVTDVSRKTFPLLQQVQSLNIVLTDIDSSLVSAIIYDDPISIEHYHNEVQLGLEAYNHQEDDLLNWLDEYGLGRNLLLDTSHSKETLFVAINNLLNTGAELSSLKSSLEQRTRDFQLNIAVLGNDLAKLLADTSSSDIKVRYDNYSPLYQQLIESTVLAFGSSDGMVFQQEKSKIQQNLPAFIDSYESLSMRLNFSKDSILMLDERYKLIIHELQSPEGLLAQFELVSQAEISLSQARMAQMLSLNQLSVQLRELSTTSQQETQLQLDRSNITLSQAINLLGIFVSFLVFVCVICGFYIQSTIKTPLNILRKSFEMISNKDLRNTCSYHAKNEFGELSTQLNHVILQQRATVEELVERSGYLNDVAATNRSSSLDIHKQLEQQKIQCTAVANAMAEMIQAISDVASNATISSEGVQEMDQSSDSTVRLTQNAVKANQLLSETISSASTQINEVAEHAQHIHGVLEVIDGIASQTNLLALNAAIEAARAGENGRGFAVVADEVRGLAKRTADSTTSVQQMIEALQLNADSAVKKMNNCQEIMVQSSVCFDEMNAEINVISDKAAHLAKLSYNINVAAQQQQVVANDVAKSMDRISHSAELNYDLVTEFNVSSDLLESHVVKQQSFIDQFKLG